MLSVRRLERPEKRLMGLLERCPGFAAALWEKWRLEPGGWDYGCYLAQTRSHCAALAKAGDWGVCCGSLEPEKLAGFGSALGLAGLLCPAEAFAGSSGPAGGEAFAGDGWGLVMAHPGSRGAARGKIPGLPNPAGPFPAPWEPEPPEGREAMGRAFRGRPLGEWFAGGDLAACHRLLAAAFPAAPPDPQLYRWEMSLRRRKGFGGAVLTENAMAAVSFTPFGTLLSQVAVAPESRGRGLGSGLVRDLCRCCPGPVYLFCRRETAGFYQALSFSTICYWRNLLL